VSTISLFHWIFLIDKFSDSSWMLNKVKEESMTRILLLTAITLTLLSCNIPLYEDRWEPRPGVRAAPFSQVLGQCESRARSAQNQAAAEMTRTLNNQKSALPANNRVIQANQALLNQGIQNQARDAGLRAYNNTINTCLNGSGYRKVRVCTSNCSN